jgi:hypothetical protein
VGVLESLFVIVGSSVYPSYCPNTTKISKTSKHRGINNYSGEIKGQ